jgi:hypothetical protein
LPLVGSGHTVDPEECAPVVRPPVGVYAGLVGTLALLAIALVWVSPASAVPSYSGQTGLPCSACHAGAFGPQLTPFGIAFVAEGYSQGGGTAPWKDIPFSLVVTPSFNTVGAALPTAPPGYNTNDFLTLGWTPFGKSTTDPGFPWLNVRVGVQYTHYLQFNGGTTNYDGFGRNASDDDTLFFFTTWAF